MEIFVAFAIWRSEMPRRSRASRSLLPKPPGMRSAAIKAIVVDYVWELLREVSNRARAAAAISTSGTARQGLVHGAGRRSHEQADPGNARAPSRRYFADAIQRDAADREHGHACGPARCPRNPRCRVSADRRACPKSATQFPRSDSPRRLPPQPLPKPYGRIARSRTEGARSTARRPPGRNQSSSALRRRRTPAPHRRDR